MIESKLDPGRGAGRHGPRPARHAARRRRARRRRPLGPRARDARLHGRARQGAPARPSRSRCSASTPCPRPASTCAWSRTTAAPAQLADERAQPPEDRAAGPPLAARKVSLETIFDAAARRRASRSSTSCSRPTCPARWRRSRTRSPSCRRTRSQVDVVRRGVGGITESDVISPPRPTRIVLGFNVRPVGDARALADREGVEIRTYAVIYRAIDELRDAMQGMLAPEEVEETLGHVEVRADLPRLARRHDRRLARSPRARSPAAPRRAWCATARSSTTARSPRCGASTTTCARSSTGYECGIVLENFADVKEGDEIEVYETRQVERDALVGGASSADSAFVVLLRIHLHFPEAGSLEGQAASSTASRRTCASAGRCRWPRSTTRTPGSARRWPWRSSAGSLGALRGARPTPCSACSTPASRRACGSSAATRHGATWRQLG